VANEDDPVPHAPRDLGDAIRALIREKDPRYPFEAYQFLYEALDHTIQRIGARRHVSGQELLEGIRDMAVQRFGPLAKMVFDRWNIHRTDDFGELVFNLVDAGLMSKQPTDSREDFHNGFDFDEAFRFDA
jgi:uncharacterized repeat protein (TIGR04138 family)